MPLAGRCNILLLLGWRDAWWICWLSAYVIWGSGLSCEKLFLLTLQFLSVSFRLIQCENEVGKLLFLTEIPELLLEDPSEAKESLALQETSIAEPLSTDGSPGLKSVLSSGRSLNNNCDSGEKPMVTFKENIKPREINREQGRIYPPKDVGRERRDYSKGIVANKNDGKKDNNKRKNETKKCGLDKMQEAGKQNVAVQVSL